MTELTEREREKAKIWYGEGWSFQEITAALLLRRNRAQHISMLNEVELVLKGT